MRLELGQFGGMAPVVDPTALSDQLATFAKNVRFDRGVLAPGSLTLAPSEDYPDSSLSASGTQAVAKMFEDGTRFAFPRASAANAFPSPVTPTDTWGRVYFMAPQGASFTTTDQYTKGALNVGAVSFRLGVPAPTGAPTISPSGVSINLGGEADRVDAAYAFAYVDKYGHEGPLSAASRRVTLAYDRTFSVTIGFVGSLPTRVNFDGGVRRVYRTTFDGGDQAWQYLIDVPVSSTSFQDTLPVGDEGEVNISANWYPAPSDLQDLCLVGASFAAGFKGHYLCYSELKLPHAWPFELQYPIKYEPVKLLPINNGLFIATTGRPYWAEGADPYSAIPQELPINAPCLSAESVVDMGGVAMYVTEEGIVGVERGQATLLSTTFLDRSAMAALVDATCTAFSFDGKYVFSTSDDRWMAFSPEEGLVEYDIGFPPSQFSSVTFSVRDNRHYFARSGGTVRVVDFSSVATNVEWRSKHWRTPPASFSCFRVEADAYPVTVRVRSKYLNQAWESGGDIVVHNDHILRLPPMVGSLWEIGIKPPEGGRVYRVILAQSGKEAA